MDKRKKYILILDVETANGLNDPMVYDIGFIVADLHGNIYEKHSYCIREIFADRPELMESAYYADKIPEYRLELRERKRIMVNFYTMRQALISALRKYKIKEVYAYNASFDRRALNTTYRYLTKSKYRWFMPYGVNFYCIWSMACSTILQHKTYRKLAIRHNWVTESGKRLKSSAEYAYRYIASKYTFLEEHKGLDDALIEYQILLRARQQKKKMTKEIDPGCFRVMKI